ncbi:MAG: helix-turn-helix domain-containing protein, partial [Lachnospiraceae bacterium]|nr:helix-turn-helix domain-containing protein [Lachnospiraceae bacterium]
MAINQDKNKERSVVDSVRTGEFLAALRKAAGYTQQEVADYLSITNKTISKWESGAGLPEISILPAVAELYGVTVDELLAGKRIGRFVRMDAGQAETYMTGADFGSQGTPQGASFREKEENDAEADLCSKEQNKQQSQAQRQVEKMAARRRWMENSLQERFRRGQVILWGATVAGYVILLGIYMGVRVLGEVATWGSVVWGVLWLLTEGVAAYVFWNRYSSDCKAWQEENGGSPQELSLYFHRSRMKWIMPFIAALSAILPLVWIEPFVIPVNIPAMVGSGEFVTTANQLLENLLTPGTLYGSSDLWDIPDLSMYHVWTVGNTFITWDRLLMALPITLLGGSLVWGCLNLSGYLYGKYRSRQTKQRLRALILAGVAGFTVMYVAGAGIQALKVVSYIQYGSQERFDQVVNDYLTVYDSYRNYEKHDGPVLEYGADRMDPQYLDTALAATERYDVYRGVFAIDYDGWK